MELLAQTGPGELRARAWDVLRSKSPEEKYLNHARAVEAIMRELAGAKDDKDEWGLAGLLHDIDIGTTRVDLPRHGIEKIQTFPYAADSRAARVTMW